MIGPLRHFSDVHFAVVWDVGCLCCNCIDTQHVIRFTCQVMSKVGLKPLETLSTNRKASIRCQHNFYLGDYYSTSCPSTVLLVNLHEDCQPSTMAEKHHPRSGLRFSLNPLTAAVLGATPPLGYKRPPTLIGSQSVSSAQRSLRAKSYASAYKSTIKNCIFYVAFGIQQFDSPAKYLTHCASETPDEKNLHVARYYPLHLESHDLIERQLMRHITTVETALKVSYPGFFEMSVGEMDEDVRQLSPDDAMEIESQSQANDSINVNAISTAMAQVSSSLSTARACTSAKSAPIPPQVGAHISDPAQPLTRCTSLGVTTAFIQDISAHKQVAPFHTEAFTSSSQVPTQNNTRFGIAPSNPLVALSDFTSEVLSTLKVAPQQAATASPSLPASMYNTASSGTPNNGPTASTSPAHSAAAALSTHKAMPRVHQPTPS